MNKRIAFASLLAVSGLVSIPASASMLLGDATAGQAIVQQKCSGCHVDKFGGDGSGVYTRGDRKVNSLEGLMAQVGRCNSMTQAGLSEDQTNDVIKYLDETYYKFPE